MNHDEQLDALLDSWQEALARGSAPTPEELCRDTPGMLPELKRRIAVLSRFEALRGDGAATTGEVRPLLTDTLPDAHVTSPGGSEPSPSLPVAGQDFGGYHIVAVLGSGGMGCVYRATDPLLKRDIALKVMRADVAVKPQARERFLREARAMAAVRHDHVVEVYQVGEVGGIPFLAMPLLDGESLAVRLEREQTLSVAEVGRIGREMAEGLAAAHAKGMIHRDIKPANVWLEAGTGRVKLLDFGLARQHDGADQLSQDGAIFGTPAYMSPEQADGENLDARSDLFGLGAVLYECATGRRPFQGKSLTAVLRAVADYHPPPAHTLNPTLPVQLTALIGELLAKKPERRPPSAQAVASSFRTIEKQCATESYHGATADWTPPDFRQRSRWHWPVAAALAVVVLALGGYFALRTPTAPTTSPDPVDPTKTVPVPLTAKLEVRVWKKADNSKSLTLNTTEALPLQAGDYMRVEIEANRAAYMYVVYLDAKGEATPLYPWRKYDWADRAEEEKRNRLYLPEDPQKDASPLTPGPSGTEAVLLLARDERLSMEEVQQLRELFANAPPQGKFDPLRGAVWLPEERFGNPVDRAPPRFDQAGRTPDPVERVRRLVRGELKALGGDVRGVCYPFQGK